MRNLILFFCGLLLCVKSINAAAQEPNRYTAEVNIDITAANAAEARDKGMKQAYRSAFLAIAGKSTTEEGMKNLSALTDEQLLNFISEAEVVSEKTSDVRYIATLKIQINDELLKTYMQEQNLPIVIRTASNIIVVPVFREFPGDAPLLWEQNNLWRKAWEQNRNPGSDNNYISLPADGINYSALDADKALRLDGLALDTVASHMGTRNIYILDAVYNGIEGLKVTVYPYNGGNPQTIFVSGDRSPDLFVKAIPEITKYIDGTIQNQSINMNTAQPSEILVIYNSSGLKDWIATENTIKNMSNVRNVTVDAMGKGKVQFRIALIGTPENLSTALKAHQLNLQNNGGFYTLDKSIR